MSGRAIIYAIQRGCEEIELGGCSPQSIMLSSASFASMPEGWRANIIFGMAVEFGDVPADEVWLWSYDRRATRCPPTKHVVKLEGASC